MGHKMAKMSATYRYIRIYVYTYIPIYPITLNGYIYSPGKKFEKIKKNQKKFKKIKNLQSNFWGPCQVLNISQQSILKQGFQKTHFPTVLEVENFFAVDLANF